MNNPATTILFGAGNCGRSIARRLTAEGKEFVFADNSPVLQNTIMLGKHVFMPAQAQSMYPDAKWIVAIGKPSRHEVMEQLDAMGIAAEEPWEYLDMKMGLPPENAYFELLEMLKHDYSAERMSVDVLIDQYRFREGVISYDDQLPCDDLADIYWPDFIVKRDDEHYVDLGGGDGDTVTEFMRRWSSWSRITVFEPDIENYRKLSAVPGEMHLYNNAVGDCIADVPFVSSADYSSHVGADGDKLVRCIPLDAVLMAHPPTFIKADIEGSEAAMLWGARTIIREYAPVLAVCAYHKSEDLWHLPLLIHALNPEYRIYLRRYSPGTMDLVYYGVPPSRVKA